MNRKGQAAMEFLMTYGWAILVVLAAIAALAYFGVLSPDKFLPEKCTMPSGLACVDSKLTSTTATLALQNSLGIDITSVDVALAGCGNVSVADLTNGAQATAIITCGLPLTSGAKFRGAVTVSYTNSDTGLTHALTGELIKKVE